MAGGGPEESRPIDLKALGERLGAGAAVLRQPRAADETLGVAPGSVTPSPSSTTVRRGSA